MASGNSTLTTEFVEFEVKRALEWLQGERNEARRYSAVLVLKELATNAPTLIYTYVPQILDLIWVALRDIKTLIREAGADALKACFVLAQVRDNNLRRQWFKKIYDEAQKGLKLNNSDSIHGSLLALRELIITGKFVDGKFSEICDITLRYKEHREGLLRRTVIQLIPDLVQLDSEQFINKFLSPCMAYLLVQIRKEKERAVAFVSIGKVAIAINRSISPYLESILQSITESLLLKVKGKTIPELQAPIFQCISMLALAVGVTLKKHVYELLDNMFSGGLTEPLRQALVDLSTHIPSLLSIVQDRLLNLLSLILCDQPYRAPGAPIRNQVNVVSLKETLGNDALNDALIILALKTLGSFNFRGHSLHELIRECAVLYLDDTNVEIRKAAALTCSNLLARDPACYQSSNNSLQIVLEVLKRLLSIGIADPDPVTRLTVLSSLDERFDHHLSHADTVCSLFIALNDEVFEIRELSMTIIGRLIVYNPAFIMPSLRKLLIKLLTELEYAGISRQKEESAKLLGNLMGYAPKLVEPYVEAILKVLLPKARDPSPGVSAKVLTAIGQLARVGNADLLPYVSQLMDVIMETLQDQSSSSKREAALKTLAQLSSNTGWVLEPYLKYPNLLDILIGILKTEQAPAIRRETIKVMGVLGALDPYRHKIASRHTAILNETQSDSMSGLLLLGPSSEDYYPAISINALMKILRDPSLHIHHTAVVTAIMYIFKTLGLKCVPFLPQIMPAMLAMMKTCPSGMLEFYFQQLGLLVTIVKQHIRGFIPDLIQIIQEHWNLSVNIQTTTLTLVESLAIALEGEFRTYLPTLLPQMLSIFESDTADKQLPSHRLLNALLTFGPNLEEYLHLVIPAIVKVFEKSSNSIAIRKQAILLIGQLSKSINICDQASRIIHSLVRVLATDALELQNVSMDVLCLIACQMGPDFVIFAAMIRKLLIQNQIYHENYERILSKLNNGELRAILIFQKEELVGDGSLDASVEVSTKKLPVNQTQLKKAWEASQRSTRDDWQEWIRRFSVELLKESPSHALRACATLAGTYYPLALELFNAGFVSCWGELYDQFQVPFVLNLG